ncbi:MAG: HNH endonuclease [Flavobacteriaceae bacterium]|nr:HNH endonuclease [Flavobacteriaceae bacterium]
MTKETLKEKGFKLIPGFENYMINNEGVIYSLKFRNSNNVKEMTLSTHSAGYSVVKFRKDGKRKDFYVHRLVMLTFVGESNLTVNHKNGVKKDNRLENLEYLSMSENVKHAWITGLKPCIKGENHFNSILTENQVIEIKNQLLKPYRGIGRDLGKKYNVNRKTIGDIRNNKTWKHVKIK